MKTEHAPPIVFGISSVLSERPPGTAVALLIEDEPLTSKIQARMLKDAGFAVLCAADGLLGVRLFMRFASQVSIVITDLIMPNLNGEQVCRRIHAHRPELPIVLVSGSADSACLRDPKHYGFAAALLKPVARATFIELALLFASRSCISRQDESITA